jgi:phage-related protein
MTGTLRTPPVGTAARIKAGELLRRLQRGALLGLPDSRPMPILGRRVHELRVEDHDTAISWRIIYRIDPDAILVVHWFEKKTRATPRLVVALCRKRLAGYDRG